MIAKAISLIFNEVDRYYLIREIDKTLWQFLRVIRPSDWTNVCITFRMTLQSQAHVKLIMSVFEYHKLVLFSEDVRK